MNFGQIKDKIKNSKKISIIFPLLLFGLGFLSGTAYFTASTASSDNDHQVRQGDYEFINPLIECEIGSSMFRQYRPFEDEVKKEIFRIMEDKDSMSYAVYFRNLNNGPWFDINAEEKFMPASLLKVPLMIVYFKESESDPAILKKSLVFEPSQSTSLYQEIQPQSKLEVGASYTVEELIYRMIAYSDNDATKILLDNISSEKLAEIYSDMGVESPANNYTEGNYMSAKGYASFFRLLYNAAYLNRANSEKALAILSKSEYKNGLAAGVPMDIKIAHKFGEYGQREIGEAATHQLHDCGIVYFPGYPYLLCVMTRGESLAENEKKISAISKAVYTKVSAYYGQDK